MVKKIICCICELPRDKFWLDLSIRSYVGWADKIIIVDGSQENIEEKNKVNQFIYNSLSEPPNEKTANKFIVLNSSYPHDDKGADGKQRSVYLSYIKKHFDGELCIVVDSDEVLADDADEIMDNIIKTLNEAKADVFNAKMIHFIDNFGWIDATEAIHFLPGRVFIISKNLYYPETEHVVIQDKTKKLIGIQSYTSPHLYYHYGYVKGKEDLIKKYHNHVKKSKIHTPEYLKQWKNHHLLGNYPKASFTGVHPKPIREAFDL